MLLQTNAALANLMGCLKEAGAADLKSLVKVTVYITDVANLTEVSLLLSCLAHLQQLIRRPCSLSLACRLSVPVRRGVQSVVRYRGASADGGTGASAA